MPFPNQEARPFTRQRVEAIAPGQMGCYGLYNSSGWIYVGKGDIRTRLLAHLNNDNACITGQQPTHFVDMVTSDMDRMEKLLIAECRPSCNKRLG